MKKRTIGRYLGLIIFLIMVILFPDDPAMKVAAVTSLMVIWWITEAIPIPATALLPIVLFPVLGILNPAEAAAPYADKIIFLFMGGFIIAMSMQRWGLHERIALHIIKIVGTSPRRLILGFMVATAFLSMWISNTATAMMMIPIAVAIIATILPKIDTKLEEMSQTQRNFSECLVISIA
ncbi:MAG: anion permease, partial [Methanogenium sp.]|nr:anion permease [Methanogenium sp.]